MNPSPQTDAADRVYPSLAPEGADLPRLVYTRSFTDPQNSLGGHALIDRVGVQIDCYARTKLAAHTLARQVRTVMADQTFKAICTNERDLFDAESRLYRHTLEFTCWDKSF